MAKACATIAAEAAELAEHVRTLELQRLDELMVQPYQAACRGDLRAVDAVLKIMDRRAQLLGLDAPRKQEHSGSDGGPLPFTRIEVHIVDPAGPAIGSGNQETAGAEPV